MKSTDVPFGGEEMGALGLVANTQNCPSGVTASSNATGTAAMTAVLTHAASFPYPRRGDWAGTIRY